MRKKEEIIRYNKLGFQNVTIAKVLKTSEAHVSSTLKALGLRANKPSKKTVYVKPDWANDHSIVCSDTSAETLSEVIRRRGYVSLED